MKQWYEIDPELLEMEKIAMSKAFPHFTLNKLDDGRLYWIGEITPGVYETKFNECLTYTVMAVYNNNHRGGPYRERMDGTVCIYPILPDANELINRMGFKHQLFKSDSANNLYINLGEGPAVCVVSRIVSFFVSYELALIGEIEMDLFNGLSIKIWNNMK